MSLDTLRVSCPPTTFLSAAGIAAWIIWLFCGFTSKKLPDRKQSIAEWFQGRTVPAQVKAIRWHKAHHKAGKKFSLGNASEIFLVPPEHYKRDFVIH